MNPLMERYGTTSILTVDQPQFFVDCSEYIACSPLKSGEMKNLAIEMELLFGRGHAPFIFIAKFLSSPNALSKIF